VRPAGRFLLLALKYLPKKRKSIPPVAFKVAAAVFFWSSKPQCKVVVRAKTGADQAKWNCRAPIFAAFGQTAERN
jgi:hypothetical protein